MYQPNKQMINAWVNEQPNSIRRTYQSRLLPYAMLVALIAGCNGGNTQTNNIQKVRPQEPIVPSGQVDSKEVKYDFRNDPEFMSRLGEEKDGIEKVLDDLFRGVAKTIESISPIGYGVAFGMAGAYN